MSVPVPAIETERLKLRAHRAGDLEPCARMWADPGVTRYIGGGKPMSRQESWARMLRYAGLWRFLDYGFWAIEEKSSGEFVGEAGLADFKRELEPSIDGVPELGWVLAPAVHGRGYATEALRAILGWADAAVSCERIVCIIDPANAPSIRVAAKLGFAEQVRTTYAGSPTVLFERIRAAR
ncbi:MAG TPA: GNAT family N-acetyltransferase [Bdellovibrionota bacterium]|nr:GNAT family N-acetyltransferase [Bdellovibrionota bacterium]